MPALRRILGGFKFPCGGAGDAWTYYYEHQEKMDLLLLAVWEHYGCQGP